MAAGGRLSHSCAASCSGRGGGGGGGERGVASRDLGARFHGGAGERRRTLAAFRPAPPLPSDCGGGGEGGRRAARSRCFHSSTSAWRHAVIGLGASRGVAGWGGRGGARRCARGAAGGVAGQISRDLVLEPRVREWERCLRRGGCRERVWPGGRLRQRQSGECVREVMGGGPRATGSAAAAAWPPARVRLRPGRRLALWWLRSFPAGSRAG